MTAAPRHLNPTACERAALQARADLAQLHKDLVAAEERLLATHTAQLLEANEQLVVSTLRAHADVETTAKELKEVSRATELDSMTGLPNRVTLLERLAHAIASAKFNKTLLALLFLDLDNFKQINDTLGHAVGDQALKQAAHCLESAVRAGDTVSRHGGDEFLILLAHVSQASDAILVAEKVIAALSAPCRVGDHVLSLTASIGISVYPDDGDQADLLIDRADAAMYLAKKHGVGSFVFHGQQAESLIPTSGERSLRPPPPSRRFGR